MRTLMIRDGTPLEDHQHEYGLLVKREDLSCLPPGPAFSKTRGVYAHVAARPEQVIGVLDTYHSQAGHAVARACQLLGKQCINYYPEFKHEPGPRLPQARAAELGAQCVPLKAGRSAVLYHQARKRLTEEFPGSYLMPNALKLRESVTETADEVGRLPEGFNPSLVIIPASSGTIAAGVILGFTRRCTLDDLPRFLVHMGYSRSHWVVQDYLAEESGIDARAFLTAVTLADEGYNYQDQAKPGRTPPWPCNPYYDLKALRWWDALSPEGRNQLNRRGGPVLFWNVG